MREKQNSNERNYGLDLLRIISMSFVLTMHILDHGGVFYNVPFFSANYKIAWVIEITAYCGVDCFVLISGYADSSPRTKYAHIIYLWMEVFFYSTVITVVFWFATHGLGREDIVSSFFPVSTKQYWFFTAYFGMFLLTPFLKKAVSTISKEDAILPLILILTLYTILPLFNAETFDLNNGYSVLWFSILYITGGIIREHNLFSGAGLRKLLPAACGIIAVTCFGKYLIELILMKKFDLFNSYERLISYTSPPIFALSVVFLLVFRQLQPAPAIKKLIGKVTPLVFSVYLIQDHRLIREHAIKNRFIPLIRMNPTAFFLSLATCVILCFIICFIIDSVRQKLFSVIKAREAAEKAEIHLRKIIP